MLVVGRRSAAGVVSLSPARVPVQALGSTVATCYRACAHGCTRTRSCYQARYGAGARACALRERAPGQLSDGTGRFGPAACPSRLTFYSKVGTATRALSFCAAESSGPRCRVINASTSASPAAALFKLLPTCSLHPRSRVHTFTGNRSAEHINLPALGERSDLAGIVPSASGTSCDADQPARGQLIVL